MNSCSRLSDISRETYPIIAKKESSSETYFTSIPIVKFTPTNIPCLVIRIENQSVCAELDLGLRGYLSFKNEFVETIKNKTFLDTKKMYGLFGKEYKDNQYRIPFTQLGKVLFSDLILLEEHDEFDINATIVKKGHTPSPKETGRIGWKIFQFFNLFLDLGNSEIAFCDSLSTLRIKGYAMSDFVQFPLLVDRGLIEFEIEAQNGILRCVLDSGASWNLINQKIPLDSEYLEEKFWDPKNVVTIPQFVFEEELQFHPLTINLPIHIDAILGMEFLKEHQVFLDFKHQQIYISRTK